MQLFTSAVTPTQDTNLDGDLTEVAGVNGYTTGGIPYSKNTTDFPTITEDDAGDKGSVDIKDAVWTAAGGNLPSVAARFAAMSAVGTVGSRDMWFYFDLGSDQQVSDTQTLTLTNGQIQITET
jgi:hypothetical protein